MRIRVTNSATIVSLPTEHDDRDDFTDRRDNKLKGRRVSFKPTRGGPAHRGRFSDMAIRQHLDNDEEMGGDLGYGSKVSTVFVCTPPSHSLIPHL